MLDAKERAKRLTQIKADITNAERDKRFCMNYFFGMRDAGRDRIRGVNGDESIGSDFLNRCGTTCCIGGAAILRYVVKPGGFYTFGDRSLAEEAGDALGLSEDEAMWLFHAEFHQGLMDQITAEEACKAIDWLIAGKPIRRKKDLFYVVLF